MALVPYSEPLALVSGDVMISPDVLSLRDHVIAEVKKMTVKTLKIKAVEVKQMIEKIVKEVMAKEFPSIQYDPLLVLPTSILLDVCSSTLIVSLRSGHDVTTYKTLIASIIVGIICHFIKPSSPASYAVGSLVTKLGVYMFESWWNRPNYDVRG